MTDIEKRVLANMDKGYSELCDTKIKASIRKRTLEVMQGWYNTFPIVQKFWDFIENARFYAKRFIKKITDNTIKIFESVHSRIKVREGVNIAPSEQDNFYLVTLLDMAGKAVYHKLGTAKDVYKRMAQHLRNKSYINEGVYSLVVDFVAPAGDRVDSEAIEDQMRQFYIKKYGKESYIRRDRFKIDDWDLNEAHNIYPRFYNAIVG